MANSVSTLTTRALPVLALAVLLCLCISCHSNAGQQSASTAAAKLQQASPSQSTATQTVASSTATSPAAHKPAPRNPELEDQLDFASEGATRGAGYEMWVHVTRAGKPVDHAIVGVVNEENRLVSKAFTDPQGDARLIVAPANYRLVAKRRMYKADESITFTRGQTYNVKLTR